MRAQNLCLANSRWLWFVEYFVKCRRRGFLPINLGCRQPQQDGGAGIRMLPMRESVVAGIRNIRQFLWFQYQFTVRTNINTANMVEPLTYFCQGFPIQGR